MDISQEAANAVRGSRWCLNLTPEQREFAVGIYNKMVATEYTRAQLRLITASILDQLQHD